MEYLATFYTHMGAINYYRYLKKIGVRAETLPVPRKYSSNCGVAVKFYTEQDIENLISEDMEKLFMIVDGEDQLIYRNELE
ncbi:MAG: DUF3343 domain-containing protein [Peptococcaceae bacterium]|nr:DUF3343 domain-containing protein [Peptococcaceae bacterium]